MFPLWRPETFISFTPNNARIYAIIAAMMRLWLLLIPLVFVLTACGGSDSSVTPATPNFVYSADLISVETRLKSLNGGVVVAGWNRLTASTTVNGAPAQVEMLANVDYVNGSGEFFGFMTVTAADESMITMRMKGNAVKDAVSGDTRFTSELSVLGGTGIYNNATGSGTFVGSRSAALGGPVQIEVRVTVR